MNIIKPNFEIWYQDKGDKTSIYKQIEKCGRVCYKSEDKITDTSCFNFVDDVLIKRNHLAMCEHGTIYLKVPIVSFIGINAIQSFKVNPHTKVKFNMKNDFYYITTNLRVIIENDWDKYLEFMCEPEDFHEKRVCVHFTLPRNIANEFIRHRVFSFAQESTRYCNYTLGKFDNNLTFILPCWFNDYYNKNVEKNDSNELILKRLDNYISSCENCEKTYIEAISLGAKPQEAAELLNSDLKTELLMTGFVSDWEHFFDLRALDKTGPAHPMAKVLAEPLYNEFKSKNWIND